MELSFSRNPQVIAFEELLLRSCRPRLPKPDPSGLWDDLVEASEPRRTDLPGASSTTSGKHDPGVRLGAAENGRLCHP